MLIAGRGMVGYRGTIVPYLYCDYARTPTYICWDVEEEQMVTMSVDHVYMGYRWRDTGSDDKKLLRLDMALSKAALRNVSYTRYFNGREIKDLDRRVKSVALRLGSLPDLGYIFSQPFSVLEKIVSGKAHVYTDYTRCRIPSDDHEASILLLSGWEKITIAA